MFGYLHYVPNTSMQKLTLKGNEGLFFWYYANLITSYVSQRLENGRKICPTELSGRTYRPYS